MAISSEIKYFQKYSLRFEGNSELSLTSADAKAAHDDANPVRGY